MPTLTIQDAFALAVQHHQAGRLRLAEQIYRKILVQQSNHAAALHHLGVIAHQMGKSETAVELIRRALAIDPRNAIAQANLGNALRETGRLDEAITACRAAIALTPNYAEAHNNLGNALRDKGQLEQAAAACRVAIALKPSNPEAHNNLGNVLRDKGQLDDAMCAYHQALSLRPDFAEALSNLGDVLRNGKQVDQAIAACRRAIVLKPNYAEAHNNLGNALRDKRQVDEAIAAYRAALRLQPNHALAQNNLGDTLISEGQLDEAIVVCRRAVALRPGDPDAQMNLGNVLKEQGQLDEAVGCYRRAAALKPGFAEAGNNLSNTLKDQGQLDEAIDTFRRAIELKSGYPEAHSNLIYTMHFHPAYGARAIAEELRAWNRRYAEPLRKFIPSRYPSDSAVDRRLRIGYVSPDFGEHVVGQNLQPLLEQHDRERFEIICYAQVSRPDNRTGQLRRHADHWRDIVGLTDGEVTEQIRQDQIDILVDLTVHSAGNRLLLFARKPAPVQVTYLGYCGSTGLETIDYRLSDPYLDPPGSDDSWASEKTWRLPKSYWCYQPAGEAPDPVPPAPDRPITFGCLNNFCKVSSAALDLWQKILDAVPNSRLTLHTLPGAHCGALHERFGDRLELVGRRHWLAYMMTYQSIDIALDPFPYNGGITTCDSLWMGIPVVTLNGSMPMGRAGRSLLSNVGLPELVAGTPDDYIRIAVELANDPDRRAQLRSTLRDRTRGSPLMDAANFARDIEAAYRQMWVNRA